SAASLDRRGRRRPRRDRRDRDRRISRRARARRRHRERPRREGRAHARARRYRGRAAVGHGRLTRRSDRLHRPHHPARRAGLRREQRAAYARALGAPRTVAADRRRHHRTSGRAARRTAGRRRHRRDRHARLHLADAPHALEAGCVMRLKPRASVVVAILVAALLLVAVITLALSVGDRATNPVDLVRALAGLGEENVVYAVREVRLPRVVIAVVVGAAFGIAGGISQGVLRNPLASPDVLGVSAGASVAAVGVMAVGALGGPIGLVPIPVAALIGGFGAAALIAALGFGAGFRGRSLLLVGIALSTALTGITQYLLTRMDVAGAQSAASWLTGSLNARGWDDVAPVLIGVAVVVPIVLILGRSA